MTQKVRPSWVVNVVPGEVSSPEGNCGSQPGTQARSPAGVKRPSASSGGSGTSTVPESVCRFISKSYYSDTKESRTPMNGGIEGRARLPVHFVTRAPLAPSRVTLRTA